MQNEPEECLELHVRQRSSLDIHRRWALELAASVRILIDEPASIVKNSCKLVNCQTFNASFYLPRGFTRDAAIFASLFQTDLTERVHTAMRKRNLISFSCKMVEQDWSAPYFPGSIRGLATDSFVILVCEGAPPSITAFDPAPQFYFQTLQWPPSRYPTPSEVLLLPLDLDLEVPSI